MQGVNKLDLAKTPFARRAVRPLLVLESDGLYLGLKPVGSALPFAQVFGGNTSLGIFRISIEADGKEIPYTVSADAFTTELNSDAGKVRFTLDLSANALRMEGDVPLLRISKDSTGANSSKLSDGVETNLGGRIIHKVRQGTFSFDDSWMLTRWSSVYPCLDITPQNGRFDVACMELPADTEPPEIAKTFDECVAENKADFEAFVKTLKPTDGLTAYELWALPAKTGSIDLAEESYLFADAQSAFDRVLASAQAGAAGIVPKFAAAALRLADDNLLGAIAGEDLETLRTALKDALSWWKTYRFDPLKGRYFYAYRAETGEGNPPWFDEAPVYAPELQERLSQLTTAASKL